MAGWAKTGAAVAVAAAAAAAAVVRLPNHNNNNNTSNNTNNYNHSSNIGLLLRLLGLSHGSIPGSNLPGAFFNLVAHHPSESIILLSRGWRLLPPACCLLPAAFCLLPASAASTGFNPVNLMRALLHLSYEAFYYYYY